MRVFAVWMRFNTHLLLIDTSDNFPSELYNHLTVNPPAIGGTTHLARFFRSRRATLSGCLTNTLPGSPFTHFCFQRLKADVCRPKVIFIVAWYWTQKGKGQE